MDFTSQMALFVHMLPIVLRICPVGHHIQALRSIPSCMHRFVCLYLYDTCILYNVCFILNCTDVILLLCSVFDACVSKSAHVIRFMSTVCHKVVNICYMVAILQCVCKNSIWTV